eukprot:TRINITY_DN789_c0_g1_i4.p1 TRINITY_DN789_c0_g1~~TRINITY_DN789_c0_g1_i4.p1  ORF type:complete len:274 (+),score=58.74 TRINITY_DN789_c0_g1_i4:840-1661(+)
MLEAELSVELEADSGNISITLIDTPGPNDSRDSEEGHVLKQAVDSVLNKVDAICCVSDASAFGQQHSDNLLQGLQSVIEENKARVYILLNKFDNVDGDTTEDGLKTTLHNYLPMIPSKRVFVTKALYCTTTNKFRKAFNAFNDAKFDNTSEFNSIENFLWNVHKDQAWFKSFVKISFGDYDDEESMKKKYYKNARRMDDEDWEDEIQSCYKFSLIEKPMQLMLNTCYKNASLICLNKIARRVKKTISELETEMQFMGDDKMTQEQVDNAFGEC